MKNEKYRCHGTTDLYLDAENLKHMTNYGLLANRNSFIIAIKSKGITCMILGRNIALRNLQSHDTLKYLDCLLPHYFQQSIQAMTYGLKITSRQGRRRGGRGGVSAHPALSYGGKGVRIALP